MSTHNTGETIAVLERNPCEPHLVGVVLAGGKSSRLGRDKALLRFGGEVDLLTRTVDLLRGMVDSVIVVGRSHPGGIGIADLASGLGPVGGITTALTHAAGAACLMLSCDLPFMRREVLVRLVAAYRRRPSGKTVCLYRRKVDGREESLVAVYGSETLAAFRRCMEEGLLKVGSVIPEAEKFHLDYDEADARAFFNINRPADLEEARRIVAARSGEGGPPPPTLPTGE